MPKGHILVVEDSPTDLRLVTNLLQSKGYQVTTATNGDEALEKAVSDKPVLILLDVVLPKKNGYQLCRQLKTGTQTSDIKVVLVTSKNQETDRFWGMKQGADAYITKPYKDEELLSTIAKLI